MMNLSIYQLYNAVTTLHNVSYISNMTDELITQKNNFLNWDWLHKEHIYFGS